MSQVRRPQHPNAALTPAHRLKMVRLVVEEGWSVPAVAQRFQVDDKTVRKWCDRYRAEGAAGLEDRSSRPRHSPNRTPEPLRRRVVELRPPQPPRGGVHRPRDGHARLDGAPHLRR